MANLAKIGIRPDKAQLQTWVVQVGGLGQCGLSLALNVAGKAFLNKKFGHQSGQITSLSVYPESPSGPLDSLDCI